MTECINEIGVRLRELRNERKLKQWQVAEKIGVHEKSYLVYEVGRRKKNDKQRKEAVDISNAHLCALADLYDVSVDYILGRTECREVARL